MIHRIEIENFGSIREAQILDLALPATTPVMDRFVPSPGAPNFRLPTVVAFFGPNAAGKSTVLRAVASTIEFVAHSFQWAPDAPIPGFQPFRSADWANRPTRITIDFDAEWLGGKANVFRYHLALGHGERGAERVLAEQLSVRQGRRFRALFRRDEQRLRCAAELHLPPSDSRLKAVRANASVVSAMAQLNHDWFRIVWRNIAPTPNNIAGHQTDIPDMTLAIQYLYTDRRSFDALRLNISRIDLGIKDIVIEKTNAGLVAYFIHEGLERPVFLFEESNGTQSFVTMFPLLWFTLSTGRPALIDEFDVDLHPLLVPEILNWFQDPEINPRKSQLFLAAHNASIMDSLEKEEIFLVEKSRDGASSITALRDIKGVRREPSLQRKYLGGAFGAIPNIG
ncbi:MAG: ATP-binding protein [Defluviicoccus sp.]